MVKAFNLLQTTYALYKCKAPNDQQIDQQSVSESRYWNNGCAVNGLSSVNEFGANICEYPGDSCETVKYFVYPEGGNGVELCCNTNSDCNYSAIKNYCHPEYKRCIDGSYVNCSEKGGPIFESCL
jgi:hypothetical protein